MWFTPVARSRSARRSGSVSSAGEPSAAAMQGAAAGSSVLAVGYESYGCSVANRFSQLLDDESDPFDVLREAELRQSQRRWRGEAAAAAAQRAGAAGRAGGGRRESQKERKQPGSSPAAGRPPHPGRKGGELQGFNNRGAEVKQDRTEWRPFFREYHSYETERQAEIIVERNKNLTGNFSRPIEILNHERPTRGCGRGGVGIRGRGRGGGINRSFDGFDKRGKREFERQSANDKNGMEQTAPMEETAETAEQPRASEGEPLNKIAGSEPKEEVLQEMTLDEWKNLQQQNRPKPGFNIRKPEAVVPSKAVVIHKSKYRDDVKKNFEDFHIFRRPVNDITSQLDINFGSLPRPGCGSRGARLGRGHGRRIEEARPRSEVQLVAPNPDDPEDFPALA